MKDICNLHLREVSGGAVIAVKVVPAASRDRIAGMLGESLKITTVAPPHKGRANAAVAGILARALQVNPRQVSLLAGGGRARKEFLVQGLGAQEVRRRLEGCP